MIPSDAMIMANHRALNLGVIFFYKVIGRKPSHPTQGLGTFSAKQFCCPGKYSRILGKMTKNWDEITKILLLKKVEQTVTSFVGNETTVTCKVTY